MAVKIKSDTSQLDEIFANFQKFTKQTIPILVRRHARLLAVELANRSQPFSVGGKSKGAKQLGQNAVNNDLSKVFRNKSSLQGIVDKTQNESIKKRLQKTLDSGNNRKIGEIFKSVGMINEFELIAKSGLKEKHKSQRSPRSGRTWSPKKIMYIATGQSLSAYTKEVQKRVGFSKSAWAECAEYIGGVKGNPTRGIPAFAKSKDNIAKGVIQDGIKSRNPFIRMESRLPWASKILPISEIKHAHHIVRENMIKQANYMIKHASKKNFNPTPIENE
jgi:hypothetical protein